MMIHTITAAMMSVPITQLMTIIAHIVANTWSTDDQRRWMRRAKRGAWLGHFVLRAAA